jgi:hypothetical protein
MTMEATVTTENATDISDIEREEQAKLAVGC